MPYHHFVTREEDCASMRHAELDAKGSGRLPVLVGYEPNSGRYEMPILNEIWNSSKKPAKQLYVFYKNVDLRQNQKKL